MRHQEFETEYGYEDAHNTVRERANTCKLRTVLFVMLAFLSQIWGFAGWPFFFVFLFVAWLSYKARTPRPGAGIVRAVAGAGIAPKRHIRRKRLPFAVRLVLQSTLLIFRVTFIVGGGLISALLFLLQFIGSARVNNENHGDEGIYAAPGSYNRFGQTFEDLFQKMPNHRFRG